jgi:hypothetical protein
MVQHRYCCAAVIILLSLLPTGIALGDDVPRIIKSAYVPWPEWVAADEAVGADGTLREDVLGPFTASLRDLARDNTARLIRDAAANGRGTAAECDECRLFRGTVPHVKSVRSIDELTTVATDIFVGEVAAMRQGFYGGLPGTLVLLSGRYIKGAAADEPLLFYPYARIKTAHGMICSKPVGDFAAPEVGDRMMLWSTGTPRNDNGRAVFSLDVARMLVHEPRRGAIRVPDVLRSHATGEKPFETIERAVSTAVERTRRDR